MLKLFVPNLIVIIGDTYFRAISKFYKMLLALASVYTVSALRQELSQNAIAVCQPGKNKYKSTYEFKVTDQ